MIGRFAPSPTGELHVGNLRTALVAWLSARSQGGSFLVRMEDLDRVTSSRDHERSQLAALAWIGLDWDGEVVRQSDRFDLYRGALDRLHQDGLTYPCFCTRRDIADAAAAPHGAVGGAQVLGRIGREQASEARRPSGGEREIEWQTADRATYPLGLLEERRYPGTCRRLTSAQRQARITSGRKPAIRLLAQQHEGSFDDQLFGRLRGWIDDVVLQRNDGVAAYNLAVVVDDAAQGVTEVVRGDDLITSTPRQLLVGSLLGYPPPTYLHVPLVLGADGTRLAKRHGAVTVGQLAAAGLSPGQLVGRLGSSLGLIEPGIEATPQELVHRFVAASIRKTPWVIDDDSLSI